MHVINAMNVNDALVSGLWWLHTAGIKDDSRNGLVKVSPTPVTTEYIRPDQRVLFTPLRDANPFFHLMESLWMIAGRNDVSFPSHYAANLASFSDDGKTLHGAYGYRWRESFGYDQLELIIKELKENPKSRRCVLSMWDATDQTVEAFVEYGSNGCETEIGSADLFKAVSGGKDVPCNTHAYFDTLCGVLNMTVCNRSNDVVWGCYGANAVHFSFLHEYVARATGIPLGIYRQISNNYHIYADRPDVKRLHYPDGGSPIVGSDDRYCTMSIKTFPIMQNHTDWNNDLALFFRSHIHNVHNRTLNPKHFKEDFWKKVIVPIANAHSWYKANDIAAAYLCLADCEAEDWKIACSEWIDRRKVKRV